MAKRKISDTKFKIQKRQNLLILFIQNLTLIQIQKMIQNGFQRKI